MESSGIKPYISFIIAARNDNYGGDFNHRLQLSVHWLAHLTQKYQLHAELVLVNYNPLPDRPGLREAMEWPKGRNFLQIRVITVPEHIHAAYLRQGIRKPVPLFEFVAKNIGIRRAKGDFVLCTNADILFSEAMIAFFAKKSLRQGILYRSDRFDFVTPGVIAWPGEGDAANFEAGLEKHVFRFFLQEGTATLRFPRSLSRRLNLLRRYNAFRRWYYFNLLKIPGSSFIPLIPKLRKKHAFLFIYHCNASGDMSLMDKASWFRIKGYLEDTWISTHTDSLQVMSAVTSGIFLEVLPWPVYHQHHVRRFDFSARNPDMDRMYQRLLTEANAMLRNERPSRNAHDDWGLAELELEEYTI